METSTARAIVKRLALRLPAAAAAATLAWLGLAHSTHAGNLHHAALLIAHSSGGVLTRCIGFLEDQISGLQLIERSGVEYQAQPYGSLGNAICQLDNEPGQLPANCFGTSAYWQYFHRSGNQWVSSSAGADNSILRDGDMDGWRYAAGPGQPPNVTFSAICGTPATPPAAAQATVSTAPRAATAAPTHAPAAVVTVSASPAASPSIEAMTSAATATPHIALATTGPPPHVPGAIPIAIWFVLAAGAMLAGLGAVNLLRRGP